jgi:ABC-type uncharacterized transport system auxiliary subunit
VFTRRIQQAALILLIAGVVAGCGASRPVKYYVLDTGPAPAASASPQFPISILVSRLSTSSLYRDDRLVYGTGAVQLNTYEYERWASPPADMMQDLVIKALRSTGAYRSVARLNSAERADYIVRGLLYALDDVLAPGLAARFSIQLELFDAKSRTTVWSGAYAHDEPVTGKAVADVVQAQDRNVNAGLTQLAGQISQFLTSHPPQPSTGQ